MVAVMFETTMTQLLVTFYQHRTRPGVIAVSPVSTNMVVPEPNDWELERQYIIEAFRRLGYCILEPGGGQDLPENAAGEGPRPKSRR